MRMEGPSTSHMDCRMFSNMGMFASIASLDVNIGQGKL
jgi:hypothetical protein